MSNNVIKFEKSERLNSVFEYAKKELEDAKGCVIQLHPDKQNKVYVIFDSKEMPIYEITLDSKGQALSDRYVNCMKYINEEAQDEPERFDFMFSFEKGFYMIFIHEAGLIIDVSEPERRYLFTDENVKLLRGSMVVDEDSDTLCTDVNFKENYYYEF